MKHKQPQNKQESGLKAPAFSMHRCIRSLSATAMAALLTIAVPAFGEGILADPTDSQLIQLGNTVYTQHCAVCHGVDLEGQPNWRVLNADGKLPAPPHDASGHTWHHSDEVLFLLTKFGVSKLIGKEFATDMPVYDNVLTDHEILAVIAYIKSTWPREIAEAQDRMNN